MYEHNTIFYFQSPFLYCQHAVLNDILHRAVSSTNVPSRLEPTGLDRADGKRPDVITNGRLLVWDATCVDTFATSHLYITASEVCAAANQAEQTKIKKYNYITSHAYHSFTPAHCLRNFWSLRPSLHVFFDGLGSPHCEHHK